MGGGVAQSRSQQPDPFVSTRQPYISSMSKFHGNFRVYRMLQWSFCIIKRLFTIS